MATSGVPSWSWPHEVLHVTHRTALQHHVMQRLNCPAPSCHASPHSTVGWCCHRGWGRLRSFSGRSSFRSCTVGWCCHACPAQVMHCGRVLLCMLGETPHMSCQVQLQVMHCGMVLSCMLGETPLISCQVQAEVSHAHEIIMSCQFQLQVMRANEITVCA